jgi:hypothetical protein
MLSNKSRAAIFSIFTLLTPGQYIQSGQRPLSAQSDDVSPCPTDYAVALIQAQVDEAKNIESIAARIMVMIRGASALRRFQQERGRVIFANAYEVAEEHFKEQSDAAQKRGELRIERYIHRARRA